MLFNQYILNYFSVHFNKGNLTNQTATLFLWMKNQSQLTLLTQSVNWHLTLEISFKTNKARVTSWLCPLVGMVPIGPIRCLCNSVSKSLLLINNKCIVRGTSLCNTPEDTANFPKADSVVCNTPSQARAYFLMFFFFRFFSQQVNKVYRFMALSCMCLPLWLSI